MAVYKPLWVCQVFFLVNREEVRCLELVSDDFGPGCLEVMIRD